MLGTVTAAMILGSGGANRQLTATELEVRISRHRFLASNLVQQGFRPNSFQKQRAALLSRSPGLQAISRIGTQEKVLNISFDDGPYPGHTERILNILKEHKVQATFYLIGNRVDDYPDLARRVVEEGHEVANHTYYHPNLTWLNRDEARAELLAASWSIQRHTGVRPTMGRPPGGQMNSMVQSVFAEVGLINVLWTISPGDLNGASRGEIVSAFSRRLAPGAILLLHDYPKATLEALPEIIKIARSKGYRFVSMGDMVPLAQSVSGP
jgi:peptidoglycan/xylan/chitin deacetylase (PgdA/CDA1 family)